MHVWEYCYSGKTEKLVFRDPFPENQRIVILLHGLGVDSTSWYFQEAALAAAGFRPVIPDLPGFGSSTFTGRWSYRKIVDVMLKFTRFLAVPRVDLMGISLGGAVCLGMMAAEHNLFGRAVLINSFLKIRPARFSHFLYMFTRFYKLTFMSIREQAVFMAGRLFPSEKDAVFRQMIVDQIMSTDRRIYWQSILELGRLNLDRQARLVSTPCLLITGEEDSTIPPEVQAAVSRKIRYCEHITIAGAGHAVIVQEPEALNAASIAFYN